MCVDARRSAATLVNATGVARNVYPCYDRKRVALFPDAYGFLDAGVEITESGDVVAKRNGEALRNRAAMWRGGGNGFVFAVPDVENLSERRSARGRGWRFLTSGIYLAPHTNHRHYQPTPLTHPTHKPPTRPHPQVALKVRPGRA